MKKGWGCPMPDTTSCSWFQLAPTDPPKDTAEPISQDTGASGKGTVRKGKMLHRQKIEEKKCEKQLYEEQGQRRRGGGAPGAATDSSAAHGGPCRSNTAAHTETMLKQINIS